MSIQYPPVIDLSHELSNGFAARFIRYKAARLVGRAGIRPCDREDVEQDLRLHLVQRFPRFDPNVAHWNAFVVTVITRQVMTLLVQRRRSKRCHDLPVVSLDDATDSSGDGQDDPDGFVPERCDSLRSIFEEAEQRDLVLDVRDLIARLPRHSRELCERLMCDSPAEVARQLRVPRTTLQGRILALRQRFETSTEKSEKNLSSLSEQTQ